MNNTMDDMGHDSFIAGLQQENAELAKNLSALEAFYAQVKEELAVMTKNWNAATAENRKLAGIEQDRDVYKELLARLLIYAQSGRIAGHQLSEQERDALFAECEAALN